jgi:TRAP-type mannitol/chloroaromatic compound transport system substrate-binding protein
MRQLAASDASVARVYESYRSYADAISGWQQISEASYLTTRGI